MANQTVPQLYGDPAKINYYGAEESDINNLNKGLEEQIQALEMRYQNPNWFKVAAGFLKPQLGGFSASLGSASEALGENLEAGRAAQLPVAQMRAQLAASKIAMGQNKKAADMVAEYQASGKHLTPEFVAEMMRIAPNAPATQSLQAQLKTQMEQQGLSQSEQKMMIDRIQIKLSKGFPLNKEETAYIQNSNKNDLPAATTKDSNVSSETTTADLVKSNPQFIFPINGASIGNSQTSEHKGVDIPAVKGTPVNSAFAGTVVSVGDNNDGYGHKIVVRHPDNTTTLYAHLNPSDTTVQSGDQIDAGTMLGGVGNTGKVTGKNGGYHLHFEHRDDQNNPLDVTSRFKPPETSNSDEAQSSVKGKFYDETHPMPDTAGLSDDSRKSRIEAWRLNASNEETANLTYFNAIAQRVTGRQYTSMKNNFDEALSMIKNRPDVADRVFNIVRQKGMLAAAAQEGVAGHAGNFMANISLPVKKALQAELDPKDQSWGDRLSSLLLQIGNQKLTSQGMTAGNTTQTEYLNALMQAAHLDQTPAAAKMNLLSDQAELAHDREWYNIVNNERKTHTNPQSITKITDVLRNSPELEKKEQLYEAIRKRYSEQFQNSLKGVQ